MLPRPILSLLANDCVLYCHLTSATPLSFCCSVVPSLHGRDAGARSSTMRPHVAHRVDGAGAAEGAPSRPRRSPTVCARGRLGVVRWCAFSRRVDTTPPHPFQCGKGNSVRTKFFQRRLHANPLLLSASLRAYARACALALSEHGRALAVVPSVPVLTPIKGTPPLIAIWPCPITASLLDSGKPSLPHFASVSTMLSMPSHPTRLPPSCAGPGAPFHLGDAPSPTTTSLRTPLFRRGQNIATGEHRSLDAIAVRLELGLKTLLCGVTIVQWSSPARPYRLPSNLHPLAATPHAQIHTNACSGRAWVCCHRGPPLHVGQGLARGPASAVWVTPAGPARFGGRAMVG
jgi:hypothetical protein